MTVKEIIKQYLKANGYDGLCDPRNECGCLIGDLMSCTGYEGICDGCEPGYAGVNEDGDKVCCIKKQEEKND